MKLLLNTVILIFSLSLSNLLEAQSMTDYKVWHTKEMTDSCEAHYLFIMSDRYFTKARYRVDNGGFINTKGGSFEIKGDSIRFFYEFDSEDKSKVGITTVYSYKIKDGLLTMASLRKSRTLTNVDTGGPSVLTGTYLFSGRKDKGEITRRNTDQPRKTMKILTGNRFQWIAFNTETGEFFGTGGGKYSAVDGKYIETIEFFSRNNARVGASLDFTYDKKGEDWHHTGLSSTGDPIYEIWSIRKK
jgi:hypothetical protein